MTRLLVVWILVLMMALPVLGDLLTALPVSVGGDPTGGWASDSVRLDVFVAPTVVAGLEKPFLDAFASGRLEFESDGRYTANYTLSATISFAFFGGPVQVTLNDTVQAEGTYAVEASNLILSRSESSDTLSFSVYDNVLVLVQTVALGDFATVSDAIDPDAPLPLASFRLPREAARSADFDGDGTVDFTDFLRFAATFGLTAGQAGFDAVADLDGDGAVDFSDFLIFAGQFGRIS